MRLRTVSIAQASAAAGARMLRLAVHLDPLSVRIPLNGPVHMQPSQTHGDLRRRHPVVPSKRTEHLADALMGHPLPSGAELFRISMNQRQLWAIALLARP